MADALEPKVGLTHRIAWRVRGRPGSLTWPRHACVGRPSVLSHASDGGEGFMLPERRVKLLSTFPLQRPVAQKEDTHPHTHSHTPSLFLSFSTRPRGLSKRLHSSLQLAAETKAGLPEQQRKKPRPHPHFRPDGACATIPDPCPFPPIHYPFSPFLVLSSGRGRDPSVISSAMARHGSLKSRHPSHPRRPRSASPATPSRELPPLDPLPLQPSCPPTRLMARPMYADNKRKQP